MSAVWLPLTFLIAVLAGWLNERQARILEFLQEENRILRRKLGEKRQRLTAEERRRLAAKGVVLGRTFRVEIATIVSPDRILRWYRELLPKNRSHIKDAEIRRWERIGRMLNCDCRAAG